MRCRSFQIVACVWALAVSGAQIVYAGVNPSVVRSPDGQIAVTITLPTKGTPETPRWTATYRGTILLDNCALSLIAAGQGDLMAGAELINEQTRSHEKRIPVLLGKAAFAHDRFNEFRFIFKSSRKLRCDIVFRCFNDAVAFRYEIPKQADMQTLTVADEGTSFRPNGNPDVYLQYLENYRTSHEHQVARAPLREIKAGTLIDMPATFAWQNGTCLAVTEAALRRFAGMSLMRLKSSSENVDLVCRLTPRDDGSKVVTRLPMRTPWRVALIGDRMGALLESHTLYCLNDPPSFVDTSWINPGKMTWAWWNGNVVKDGKPEPPIFSMEAQKRYIDFCAASGIPFHSVIADNSDTPWYRQSVKGVVPGPDTDVTQVRVDLDLAEIRRYARAKGVRLWTWVHQAALRGRVEEAFSAFERFGWSGMMVDFFDHDDQDTVEFAEDILKAAARHHILIHFHGIWKPTGLQRTYPNLVNHEGALNLEYLKWSDLCTPEHTLNLAFTRLVAGPMDYHLGGFRAVTRPAFKPSYVAPNVLGTRCFQLAAYICFDNPNPMVADYPDAYKGQPGFDFLMSVPTWWDETRILQGAIGRTLVTARRKGKVWYLGAMSAGGSREIEIPLTFLGSGPIRAQIWHDISESDADPNRLSVSEQRISAQDSLRLRVAADGGFVVVLTPTK